MTDFAARMRIVREALGLTQKNMSAHMSLSENTWPNYERGITRPGSEVLEQLVEMGFEGTWLLTGNGEMRRDTSAVDPVAHDQDISADDADLIINCFIAVTELLEESNTKVNLQKQILLSHNMFRRERARQRSVKEDRTAVRRTVDLENLS